MMNPKEIQLYELMASKAEDYKGAKYLEYELYIKHPEELQKAGYYLENIFLGKNSIIVLISANIDNLFVFRVAKI